MDTQPNASLNSFQKHHLLSSARHIDELLREIEDIVLGADAGSAFPKYRRDLTAPQAKVTRDYIAQIRAQLLRVLHSQGIDPPEPQFGSLHSIRVTLQFALIDVEECRPEKMRGYGEVPQSAVPELEGLLEEVRSSLNKLDVFLRGGDTEDLKTRVEKQVRKHPELGVLARMERIVDRYGLVEFRSALGLILDRLDDQTFEIAVFGRVSSGKSSLLNTMIGDPVLPVGVNPITSVPTRVVSGSKSTLTIWEAGRAPVDVDIGLLSEYVTEQRNPGNRKQIIRIRVTVRSDNLPHGVVLVDTPGVGSVATSGALETMAYLPRCDYGVVLIDAASSLSAEELTLIRSLRDFGIPVSVLLSKADLLATEDREQALEYTRAKLEGEFGTRIAVHAVSTKSEHSELLSTWLMDEIFPLYAHRDEVRLQSLQQRIEVLKQSVSAALGARRGTAEASRPDAATAEDSERRLRIASGQIERTRTSCIDRTHELRRSAEAAVDLLVRKAMQTRTDSTRALDPKWFTDTLKLAAGEEGTSIAADLTALATDLANALENATATIGLPIGQVKDELLSVLREMPVFDIGPVSVTWRPGPLSALVPALARSRLATRLKSVAASDIEAAFASYGRLLEDWVRRATGDMQRRFESYADGVRAQIRAGNAEPRSAADGEALESEIRGLSMPVAGAPSQSG